MYEYFEWVASLHKTNKIMSGLLVLVTMAGMGTILALIADIFIRLTGINVGSYKKEYEDQLPGH